MLLRLRRTVQRLKSSPVPLNSSDLALWSHWLGAPVTRTSTVAEALMPCPSVTVPLAVEAPAFTDVYVGSSWVDVSALVPVTPKSHRYVSASPSGSVAVALKA